MPDVIEPAASGRAKCRGCGKPIEQGELRFGERVPNPFGDGEASLWFHVRCAAFRRPERFAALEAAQLQALPDAAALQTIAKQGVEHHRLPRITGLEHAKSGRAKCRHCKSAIAAGELRLVLTIWQEARFVPMGFVHGKCSRDYFGTSELEPWLRFAAPEMDAESWEELKAVLSLSANG